ncbi:hypothetical protein V6N11_074567 [Hibiscus sabdariffa]|uniref:Uncharacterized protein n=1 Tax=Hibiscus sabdariffa TaxID=183260 RepID=A0ABR2R3X3_9ROSI
MNDEKFRKGTDISWSIRVKEVIQDTQLVVLQSRNCNAKRWVYCLLTGDLPVQSCPQIRYGLELSHFVHQAVPLIQLFGIVILQNTNKRIFSIQCETQPLVDIRNVGDITRVSEDLDFADNAGGTVVITGMPFSTRTETPRFCGRQMSAGLSDMSFFFLIRQARAEENLFELITLTENFLFSEDLRGFLFLKGSPGKRNEREEGGWKEKKKRSLQGKKMTSHEHEQGQDQKKGDLVGNRLIDIIEDATLLVVEYKKQGAKGSGSKLERTGNILKSIFFVILNSFMLMSGSSEELDFADNAGGTVVITGMPFSTRTETPRHETASKLIDIIEDATLLVVEYKKQGAKGSRLIGYLLLFLSRAPSHGGERASSSMVTSVNRGLIDELEIPICNTTKESNFLVYGKRLLNHPIHPKERGRGLCICMTPVDFSILPRDTIPCNFGQTLAFCLGRSLLIVGKRSKGQNMVQREVAESWKALTTSLQIHVQDAKVTATDIFKDVNIENGSPFLGTTWFTKKIHKLQDARYSFVQPPAYQNRHSKVHYWEVIQDTQLVVLQSRNCNAKTSTEIGVGSIVFSPGTLSPFDSFAQELKLLSLPLSPFDSFAQELKLYGLELSHLVHQVSEDLDFADNAGGTVVITGMPFSTRTETPRFAHP